MAAKTGTYTLIASTTLSSAAANIDFTSISTSYTDLVLVFNGSLSGFANIRVRVGNGSLDTANNYSTTRLLGDGTSASSDRVTSTNGGYSLLANTNDLGNTIIHFLDYANTTTYKTFLARGNATASSSYVNANVNLWRSTSAINTISLYASTGNINSGATARLYGIEAGNL